MEFLLPILAKIELICQQPQVSGAHPNYVWGVKWTFILHLPISVILISDIGKSFSDIGKSSHFAISEIRITDIVNSSFRYRKIEFLMSDLDLPISENHPIYRYRKFEFPILVIQHDFPMSENQLIYRYRKIDFPISVIQNDFLISVNQPIYR